MFCKWIYTAGTAAALALAGSAQAETIAIINAHIVTPGPVGDVPEGTVLIEGDRIAAAGANVAVPASAHVIDAKGAPVTPGLIAVDTMLGLKEVSSVSGTTDNHTTSPGISAALDVQYGLNPDSTMIPIARLGGITRAVAMPDYDDSDKQRHLAFAGQAAMISLEEGPDILFKPRIGMVLEMGEHGAQRAGGSRAAEIIRLRMLFDALQHRKQRGKADTGGTGLSAADLEALRPVASGAMPLIVSVHSAPDIRQALKLARDYRLKIVLNGAEEAWRAAPEIASAHVPVMLTPPSNMPSSFELLGATLHNAAMLNKAGVEIAITGNDPTHSVRDMRFNAGIAVSRGLPYAAAIEAITLTPARMFGLDGQLGSIAPGKIADIVIWDGDPLEPLSGPTAIFVAGKVQPMTSRQRELRDRYLEPAP
ncbi:amidohydrolase family protein [Novosphingobium beihaiensis]|uniref:Amidohydrolase family protein n=1 Tax=Novosphingobium beihaiensis TaxID=2930389 RepID=A0ABT0BLC1_9SPHN|nr:amidohydrolase family protein [Novosphingobium beihaiensis]MCJ2185753.1 amidohydrolase family protein [Novosphingobium beihaiensis]